MGAFFRRARAIAILCNSETRVNNIWMCPWVKRIPCKERIIYVNSTVPVSVLHSIGLHAHQQVYHSPFKKKKKIMIRTVFLSYLYKSICILRRQTNLWKWNYKVMSICSFCCLNDIFFRDIFIWKPICNVFSNRNRKQDRLL